MATANTARSYGSVERTLHWLTALLILTAIPLGLYASDLPYATGAELARKAQVFSLHKTVGVTAFFVALIRIVWALTQTPTRPDPPRPAGGDGAGGGRALDALHLAYGRSAERLDHARIRRGLRADPVALRADPPAGPQIGGGGDGGGRRCTGSSARS